MDIWVQAAVEAAISQLEEDISSGSRSGSDAEQRRLDALEKKAVSLNSSLLILRTIVLHLENLRSPHLLKTGMIPSIVKSFVEWLMSTLFFMYRQNISVVVFKNLICKFLLSVSCAAGVQIEEGDALALKVDQAQYESVIEEGKRDLNDCDTKLKYLRREKDLIASESADLAALRLKKEELAEKETSLQKLYSSSLQLPPFRLTLYFLFSKYVTDVLVL